jgi:hypothetical protein
MKNSKHYCLNCKNALQKDKKDKPINMNKIIKKKKVSKKLLPKTNKAKTKHNITKDPVAYYMCMQDCCKKKPLHKKITEVARECKANALAFKAKISAQKAHAVKKITNAYLEIGKGLTEFIKDNG